MTPRPTMQDIAARAGVSKMTVSYALRNELVISLKVRKKILKIAREMGYRLDPFLSSFSSHTKREIYHGTLAWIDNSPMENGSFVAVGTREYFRGATEQAKALGFKLEVVWTRQPGMNPKRLSRILITRNIRGLVLPPQPEVRGEMEISWEQFSVITFGYTLDKPRFHMVSTDQLNAVRMAVQKLRTLGYQRIGLAVHERYNRRVNHNYLAGYLLEQQGIEKKSEVSPLLLERFKVETIIPWFLKNKPDGVITTNGDRLEAVFRREGIRVPQDVGIVDFSYHSTPELSFTFMDFCNFSLGQRAVSLLVGMMARNERGIPRFPLAHLIQAVWTPGQTTRVQNERLCSK